MISFTGRVPSLLLYFNLQFSQRISQTREYIADILNVENRCVHQFSIYNAAPETFPVDEQAAQLLLDSAVQGFQL